MNNNSFKTFLLCLIVILVIFIIIKITTSKENDIQTPKGITVDAIKLRPALLNTHIYQKIPKIIVQCDEFSKIPKDMRNAIQTIINDNAEYTYIYFDDQTSIKYLEETYDKRIVNAYNKLIPGACKADLFRYCFLYKSGGVYIDSGMVSKLPLNQLINPEDEFISPEDNNTGGIYNAFMCCIPQHPILKEIIERYIFNIEHELYRDNPLSIGGPLLLGNVFRDIIGKDVQIDTNYDKNVRLIFYKRTSDNPIRGNIGYKDKIILITKYYDYAKDAKWYRTNSHYSILWNKRQFYKQDNSPKSLDKYILTI